MALQFGIWPVDHANRSLQSLRQQPFPGYFLHGFTQWQQEIIGSNFVANTLVAVHMGCSYPFYFHRATPFGGGRNGPVVCAETGWAMKLEIIMKSRTKEMRLFILELHHVTDLEIPPSFGMNFHYILCGLF